MRIVVNGRFGSNKTGVGRVIEGLFSHLQFLDNKNEYFIIVNKEFKNFLKFTNPNFHLISNGISARNMILNHIWSVSGFLYTALKLRADLIILPGIVLYPFKIAPTIYWQHDLIEYHIPNQKWYKLLFRRFTFPITLRKVDRIIGVSRSTINDIKKIFNISEDKLMVLYNGVATNLFKQMPREKAKEYLNRKYKLVNDFILYVGTLTLPQKNLLRLVNAYSILVNQGLNQKLIMVGGKGKDSHLIFKRVKELKLQNNVIFTGYVPDEDLPYFYNVAKVFCFPSIYEGFGLPVLEAMACGCPVVTSNTSSLPEVAGNAALLVDPYNESEIANAIERLLTDEQLRQECITKGLIQSKRFSWENTARQFLNLVDTLSS
ncbi:MAG: glycosyltransferase family 4 protein [Promethearchaeota archaeon]